MLQCMKCSASMLKNVFIKHSDLINMMLLYTGHDVNFNLKFCMNTTFMSGGR